MIKFSEEDSCGDAGVNFCAGVVSAIAVNKEMSNIVLAEATSNFVLLCDQMHILFDFTDFFACSSNWLVAKEHDSTCMLPRVSV